MMSTLQIAFSLRITYKVNSVIWFLRQIPLIGKRLPEDLYKHLWIKILAMVVALIWEIHAAFLGKLLYFLLMIFAAGGLYESIEPGVMFGHLLLILTLAGASVDTYLMHSDEPTYYAVLLLGMDAKQYSIVRWGYAMIKYFLGFLVFGLIFGLLMGANILQCLLVPFYVLAAKSCYCGISLLRYEKTGDLEEKGFMSKLGPVILIGLLAAAYGLPLLGIVIPEWAVTAVMLLILIPGWILGRKVFTFGEYRILHQQLRQDSLKTQAEVEQSVTDETRKQIVTGEGIHSDKHGFAYLNDLFFQRHKKLFWKSSLWISAAAGAITVALCALAWHDRELASMINGSLMNLLPISAFLMYLLNRGTNFTQALFINCDHSLLTYSFFKQPKYVLKLFSLRLMEIIKVNLLPATVIAAGLPLMLYCSGGTEDPWEYAILAVTILSMSIFFSTHYLMLYYLFQPYTAGTQMKGGVYQFLTGLTYFVCYVLIDAEIPSTLFSSLSIVFCLVYSAVACVAVYIFAPKTFRLRT